MEFCISDPFCWENMALEELFLLLIYCYMQKLILCSFFLSGWAIQTEEVKKTDDLMTSPAAFVEGGIQDACDDACSICLEEFTENDPSTVIYLRIKHCFLFKSFFSIIVVGVSLFWLHEFSLLYVSDLSDILPCILGYYLQA